MKKFSFKIKDHFYGYEYDDVKELIDHLVDVADSDKSPFNLGDVLGVVRLLARREKEGSAK